MVQQPAQPAEELGVRKSALSDPAEVFVVLSRVLVEEGQVLGQAPGAWEAVHVKERVGRRHGGIILRSGSHHHRQNLHQQYCHQSFSYKSLISSNNHNPNIFSHPDRFFGD